MAITAGTVLGKVSKILQDEDTVRRWPTDTELLGWLDSAQLDAVLIKPTAHTSTATVQLAAGTKQSLPSGGLLLLSVTRNMGTGGATPGMTIKPISREALDRLLPDWHTHAARDTVKLYAYDPSTPKEFYVYPPQPSTSPGYIETVCSTTPSPLASTDDNIALDDIYEGALIDGVLARCYEKDSEIATAAAAATSYRKSFAEKLGLRTQVEAAMDPAPEPPAQPAG